MDSIVIKGGYPLKGSISVSGAKNAALPLMASSLLADGESRFLNIPDLRDVVTMGRVLRRMGASVSGNQTLSIDSSAISECSAPYELVSTMRASVLVLGPLLARYGRAKVSLPGGCAIGARPIDQHLKGFRDLGANIDLRKGYVEGDVPGRLRGAEIVFDLVTVTGTMNVMMAACLATGRSRLINAAKEPEVEELAFVLNKMGGKITGAGTSTITIDGVDDLRPIEHAIIPDRIEAGTFMVAAAATGGDVWIENAFVDHLRPIIEKLRQANIGVELSSRGVRIFRRGAIRAFDIVTEPHPGFPTDMQAQFMVLAALAEGRSTIEETVFENRFMHVPELNRMNAQIEIDGRRATIHGPTRFSGATVMASDLRASAALVIAALVSNQRGEARINRVYHLDRGYEKMDQKLRGLGASIERVADR